MATHNSAIRQRRRSIRRAAINKKNRSGLRTGVRKMRDLFQAQQGNEARKNLAELQSTIDKTVKKGAISKNKGNRLKSRLSRQAARTPAAPAAK
jgi:small subunit ribosomal protein S20